MTLNDGQIHVFIIITLLLVIVSKMFVSSKNNFTTSIFKSLGVWHHTFQFPHYFSPQYGQLDRLKGLLHSLTLPDNFHHQ